MMEKKIKYYSCIFVLVSVPVCIAMRMLLIRIRREHKSPRYTMAETRVIEVLVPIQSSPISPYMMHEGSYSFCVFVHAYSFLPSLYMIFIFFIFYFIYLFPFAWAHIRVSLCVAWCAYSVTYSI